MASYKNREPFIPYRRTDIIELCIEDGQLSADDVPKFRQFCHILSAYYHFKLHNALETLKDNFAPFDPDADTRPRVSPTSSQLHDMQSNLLQTFEQVLQRANYQPLNQADLQQAFEEESLIPLNTKVDFDDFDKAIIYYRGQQETTTTIKQFFVKKTELTFDMYERVVMFLKFKDAAHFEAKNEKLDQLPFVPGKIYIFLYKNIPKFDLELLFPNIEVSMTLKDRILFGVPAVGAAVPIALRALPSFGLIFGIILLLVWGPSFMTESLDATDDKVRNFYPVLTGLLMALVALGGFAFKQYTNYKNKRIKFQKEVTDTLFFRNLENNGGVFHGIINAAEEEETKEMILAYYHLLTSPQPLRNDQLDDQIEQWFADKFEVKLDFDVRKALENLSELEGEYLDPQTQSSRRDCLATTDEAGAYTVLPLPQAKTVIDHVWDNLFNYNL
ncbi:TMEM143 family protein [Anaerolineales bacterium HSG6]|nr:TMEM143 family protein [Anaerolineales bacterium HSG6]